MTIFFRDKDRQRLEATITAKQAEIERLQNILAERDRLITELRQALDAPRRSPFLSVGHGDGSGETTYERATLPEWL
jgi:predicted RNase H-like nuclease (RuvC/YqgF family)